MRDAVPRVPGRPPKLTIEQARRIYTLVVGIDPRQLRFDFALWTRDMVAELIVGEFGIALSRTAVGRLLRRMGVSPQRPLWRARQADPPGVQRWKNEEFESNGVKVSDSGLRRMVITGFGSRTHWWNPETGRLTLLVARPATADIAANRLVVTVPHPSQQYAECIKRWS